MAAREQGQAAQADGRHDGRAARDLRDVDIQLLTALQEDADRTNVELARLAGLSPAATLHRVRRLKESGVIRVISAQLDPAAAGADRPSRRRRRPAADGR